MKYLFDFAHITSGAAALVGAFIGIITLRKTIQIHLDIKATSEESKQEQQPPST